MRTFCFLFFNFMINVIANSKIDPILSSESAGFVKRNDINSSLENVVGYSKRQDETLFFGFEQDFYSKVLLAKVSHNQDLHASSIFGCEQDCDSKVSLAKVSHNQDLHALSIACILSETDLLPVYGNSDAISDYYNAVNYYRKLAIYKLGQAHKNDSMQDLLCEYFAAQDKENFYNKTRKEIDEYLAKDIQQSFESKSVSHDKDMFEVPRLWQASKTKRGLREFFGLPPKLNKEDKAFLKALHSGDLFEQFHAQIGAAFKQQREELMVLTQIDEREELIKETIDELYQERYMQIKEAILGKVCIILLLLKIEAKDLFDPYFKAEEKKNKYNTLVNPIFEELRGIIKEAKDSAKEIEKLGYSKVRKKRKKEMKAHFFDEFNEHQEASSPALPPVYNGPKIDMPVATNDQELVAETPTVIGVQFQDGIVSKDKFEMLYACLKRYLNHDAWLKIDDRDKFSSMLAESYEFEMDFKKMTQREFEWKNL